jgi:hypothetical protein
MDSGDEVEASQVGKGWRLEEITKGDKKYYRWRWQKTNNDGTPAKTESGGYKRGSKYIPIELAKVAKNGK